MRRPVLAAFAAVAAAAALVWGLSRLEAQSPPAPEPVVAAPVEPQRPPARELAPAPPKPEAPEVEAEAAPQVLDPNSTAFAVRVDEVIPARLYAVAADRCYDPHVHPDGKVRLGLRLRAVKGQILVWEVTVLKDTIKNRTITDCIVDAVKNASWADPEMPDWEDEDELVIRIGGMKKHLEDQDNSDEGNWAEGGTAEEED